MAYTNEDLLSALEKVGSIEFTEAEAEAMADLFAQDDVEGFGGASFGPGRFALFVDGEAAGYLEVVSGGGGIFNLGFTATDDLWK